MRISAHTSSWDGMPRIMCVPILLLFLNSGLLPTFIIVSGEASPDYVEVHIFLKNTSAAYTAGGCLRTGGNDTMYFKKNSRIKFPFLQVGIKDHIEDFSIQPEVAFVQYDWDLYMEPKENWSDLLEVSFFCGIENRTVNLNLLGEERCKPKLSKPIPTLRVLQSDNIGYELEPLQVETCEVIDTVHVRIVENDYFDSDEPTGGILKLRLKRKIDDTTPTELLVTIRAKDSGKPPYRSKFELMILVIKYSQPVFRFDQSSATIREHDEQSEFHKFELVLDTDIEASVHGDFEIQYRFYCKASSDTCCSHLQIAKTSAKITIIKPIDSETIMTEQLSCNVRAELAKSPNYYTDIPLTIHVEPIDDRKPELILTSTDAPILSDHLFDGQDWFQIAAVDGDFPEKFTILRYVTPGGSDCRVKGNGFVRIHPRKIHSVRRRGLNCTVCVNDSRFESCKTWRSAVFPNSSYFFSVITNGGVKPSAVINVKAVYNGDGPIAYSIAEDTSDSFKISSSGDIYTDHRLPSGLYNLTVAAAVTPNENEVALLSQVDVLIHLNQSTAVVQIVNSAETSSSTAIPVLAAVLLVIAIITAIVIYMKKFRRRTEQCRKTSVKSLPLNMVEQQSGEVAKYDGSSCVIVREDRSQPQDGSQLFRHPTMNRNWK